MIVRGLETEIETPRLVLVRWSDVDRNLLAGLARDPRVTRHIGDGTPWSDEKIEEAFAREAEHWDRHGFGWRAAIDKESGTRIGFIGLNHLPPEAVEVAGGDDVEIGWWLAPAAWGRGLATEGASALRDEAFEDVGLDRIIARYQPENIASGLIMERIGMSFERDATGRHGETVRIYALGRSEWAALEIDGRG